MRKLDIAIVAGIIALPVILSLPVTPSTPLARVAPQVPRPSYSNPSEPGIEFRTTDYTRLGVNLREHIPELHAGGAVVPLPVAVPSETRQVLIVYPRSGGPGCLVSGKFQQMKRCPRQTAKR